MSQGDNVLKRLSTVAASTQRRRRNSVRPNLQRTGRWTTFLPRLLDKLYNLQAHFRFGLWAEYEKEAMKPFLIIHSPIVLITLLDRLVIPSTEFQLCYAIGVSLFIDCAAPLPKFPGYPLLIRAQRLDLRRKVGASARANYHVLFCRILQVPLVSRGGFFFIFGVFRQFRKWHILKFFCWIFF